MQWRGVGQKMPRDLSIGPGLHHRPLAVQVPLNLRPEQQSNIVALSLAVGLSPAGRINARRDQTKQPEGLSPSKVRGPGCAVPADGQEMLLPLEPVPQEVEDITALPPNAETSNRGVPDQSTRG